jgi:signal transduction histidine kinase
MNRSQSQPNSSGPDIPVPFSRVAGFVRQVTHDVRNGLNAIDLQTAYTAELVSDPEAVEEVRRIRALIQQTTRMLQALSSNFWLSTPNPVPYSARIFVEDLQDRLVKQHPDHAPQVRWEVTLKEESIAVDLEMIFTAIAEVLKNAFSFREAGGEIAARVFAEGGRFVLEITEPKSTVPSPPEAWGREPFASTRRGGYGLGLFRSRQLLAAHGGDLQFSHDSGRNLLSSRISLPLADPS